MAILQAINASVQIIETTNSKVNINKVLNVQGFKLEKVLEMDPNFLQVSNSSLACVPQINNAGYSLLHLIMRQKVAVENRRDTTSAEPFIPAFQAISLNNNRTISDCIVTSLEALDVPRYQ